MSDRSHIDAMDMQAATIRSHAAEADLDRALATRSPFHLYRPRLSIDGDQWCALYGENLQDGVAGFGDSPAKAEAAFNAAWNAKVRAAAQPPAGETESKAPPAPAVPTPQQRASRLIDMWTRNGVDVGDITLRVNLVDELAAAAREGAPPPADAARAVSAEHCVEQPDANLDRAARPAAHYAGITLVVPFAFADRCLRAAEQAAEARVRAEKVEEAEYRVTNALAEADTWRRTAEKLVRERNAKPAAAERLKRSLTAAEAEAARLRADLERMRALCGEAANVVADYVDGIESKGGIAGHSRPLLARLRRAAEGEA